MSAHRNANFDEITAVLYQQYGCTIHRFEAGLIILEKDGWFGTLRAVEPEDEYPNAALRITLGALKIDWNDFWSKLP